MGIVFCLLGDDAFDIARTGLREGKGSVEPDAPDVCYLYLERIVVWFIQVDREISVRMNLPYWLPIDCHGADTTRGLGISADK